MNIPKNTSTNPQKTESNSISSLTQERATESNAIQIPEISLPKGGGALKGIDEKFEVNAANGTASFSIPLPITPGRNGFSPSLSLSYNSGGGNSPFGLGWSVGYPMIQRKTDKKLPRYRNGLEEDTFMFSGAEDLVPFLEPDGNNWRKKAYPDTGDYTIKRYRPRIEGGFARIEKITHPDHGTYWKITTRENVATIFGRNKNARIANPEDETQIFQWMPEFSYDDKGNWIKYEYKKEDSKGYQNEVYEKNRKSGIAPFTNTYLKRVKYGNRTAYYANSDMPYNPQAPIDNEFFFELVMDYGEHTDEKQPHLEKIEWPYRSDAFSSYRSGFEIRTNRLCKRVLMFHHFKDNSIKQWDGSIFGENYLVRSLDLNHETSSGIAEVTYLKSITQRGFIRTAYDKDDKSKNKYSQKHLPPMEFTYEKLNWNKTIKTVSQENIINAPVGLTNNYQWVDLYGEGVSGILTEQGGAWFYKSRFYKKEEEAYSISFTPAQQVIPKPSFTGLSHGVLSLQDLAANGEKQIVVNSPDMKGYFELTHDNDWKPFQAFEQIANVNLQAPNTRLLDLNGDGQPDIVITEDNVFTWYAADGKRGHLPAERSQKTFDEEQGPAIVFADELQTIFLADMVGDGLTDIVRIRNGEICYWANKGYGKFSAKITMGNAPLFDTPDLFNPKYLHLADVSGTGATDIIYLGKNKFKAFINLSGNAWSDAHEIEPFFPIDNNSKLSVIDLLGTGTSCIVWSSDLPAYTHAPMRYIDLMSSKKPHVLIHYKNNFGKETSIEYKSSTHYYLKDKLEGKPWVTKLPFPVQVVSKMTIEEKITNVRFTNAYRYHHGYYDHVEREFRGFGMVEQVDTEHYDTYKEQVQGDAQTPDYTLYQAPVLTKTWYHTGAYLDKKRILNQFKSEYWIEEYNRQFPDDVIGFDEPNLPEAQLSDMVQALQGDEFREALRACKGMMLRQEVFALDAPDNPTDAELQLQMKPYTVATHNCNIQLLQARDKNKYGVFLVTESEAINIHYERDETDFRVAHTLNVEIDNLGNVLESASVVYGRAAEKAEAAFQLLSKNITDFSEDVLNNDDTQQTQLQSAFVYNIQAAESEQTKTHIIYTQNNFAAYSNTEQDIDKPHVFRTRLPYETKTYEVTGLPLENNLYKIEQFAGVLLNNHLLIEHIKTRHLKDDLKTPYDFGRFDTLGLPYENYQLAFTSELLSNIYGNKKPSDAKLENDGKFIKIDEQWWIRSGISHFKEDAEDIEAAKSRFFSPIKFKDPFGSETKVTYDKYFLYIKETQDVAGNKIIVDKFNYRTMSPSRMIDINANPTSVLLDELGLVKAMAIEGNGDFSEAQGYTLADEDKADDLEGLKEYSDADEQALIAAFFNSASPDSTNTTDLRTNGDTLINHATIRFVYDFDSYRIQNKPTVVASITREEHYYPIRNDKSSIQFSFEYTDGLGNVAMTKVQAEPGDALYINNNGVIQTKNTGTELRWIGNGRTVLNNKGNPVKQYEPYFSINFLYEDSPKLVEIGVTPILHYDSLGRLIKTEFPDGTLSRVEFDSWKQINYDQNDTVLESDWYQEHIQLDGAKKQAALKAAAHANTPSSLYLDSLGRPVLSISDNGLDYPNLSDQAGNKFIFLATNTTDKRGFIKNGRYFEVNIDQARHQELGDEVFIALINAKKRLYTTFIKIDIEGNAKAVIDARGNTVMAYQYDMLGHRVYQNSMDAGERWVLNNVMGNPIHRWDSRSHVFSFTYDSMQRPESIDVREEGNTKFIYELNTYGEGQIDDFKNNLRGQLFQKFDTAGKVENIQFGYKGNLIKSSRQLLKDYKSTPDWLLGNLNNQDLFETEIYITQIYYDALNRIKQLFNWHSDENKVAVHIPSYNARGLVKSERIWINAKRDNFINTGEATTPVSAIEYNEKGQKTRIRYGNNTTTRYHYDKKTFRLLQLRTTKDTGVQLPSVPSNLADPNVLQNLYYTYDAVGNITENIDDAFEPVFFKNQNINPISKYTYDAIYRLTKAEGRENSTFNTPPTNNTGALINGTFPKITDNTLRNYTQHYQYDPVGNVLKMRHQTTNDPERWTRYYSYKGKNNQLLKTWTGANETNAINYRHDVHGNMNNLIKTDKDKIVWDYQDMIQHIEISDKINAYYQYAENKERSRKVIVTGNTTEERIYLGGVEVYRKKKKNGELIAHIETHHIQTGEQRSLLVENVIVSADNNLPTAVLYRYQYSNHLGSVGLELNEKAEIISYEEYHPYGTTAYQAMNEDIKATAKRYRYTGMERDEESGLAYHSARYYLPWLGRWLSADPIGIGDGINVYSYTSSNPNIYRDSQGTSKGKAIGWVVKRVGKKLHKTRPVFTQKEARKLFGKGHDVLLKSAKKQELKAVLAKQYGKKAVLSHSGHPLDKKLFKEVQKDMAKYLRKGGKLGLPHTQIKNISGRHIFGGTLAAMLTLGSNEALANVEMRSIYSNPYPGKSIAHNLTLTHHLGDDSLGSYLDYFNPGEYIAFAGDIGRTIDREIGKEFLGTAITITDEKKPVITFEFNKEGSLGSVLFHDKDGHVTTMDSQSFYHELDNNSSFRQEFLGYISNVTIEQKPIERSWDDEIGSAAWGG